MNRLLHGDNDCVNLSFTICELCYLHYSIAIVDPLSDFVCVSLPDSLTAGQKTRDHQQSTMESLTSESNSREVRPYFRR